MITGPNGSRPSKDLLIGIVSGLCVEHNSMWILKKGISIVNPWVLSLQGSWMWSSPLPCGWSTLDWSFRGPSLEMKTFTRPTTKAYLVCNTLQFESSGLFSIRVTLLCLSLSDAFAQIISTEGVGVLWNGTLPSLILVLNPAVQFMFYEAMKRRAGREGRKVRGGQEGSGSQRLRTKSVWWVIICFLSLCCFPPRWLQ